MAEKPTDPLLPRILEIEAGMYRQFALRKAKLKEAHDHNSYAWKLHDQAMALRKERAQQP